MVIPFRGIVVLFIIMLAVVFGNSAFRIAFAQLHGLALWPSVVESLRGALALVPVLIWMAIEKIEDIRTERASERFWAAKDASAKDA